MHEQMVFAKIRQFLRGRIDVDAFDLWLSGEAWETDNIPGIAGDALLWLAEYGLGHRSLDELRTLLAGKLYLYEMRPPAAASLSSSSFTVFGTQTFRIGTEP